MCAVPCAIGVMIGPATVRYPMRRSSEVTVDGKFATRALAGAHFARTRMWEPVGQSARPHDIATVGPVTIRVIVANFR